MLAGLFRLQGRGLLYRRPFFLRNVGDHELHLVCPGLVLLAGVLDVSSLLQLGDDVLHRAESEAGPVFNLCGERGPTLQGLDYTLCRVERLLGGEVLRVELPGLGGDSVLRERDLHLKWVTQSTEVGLLVANSNSEDVLLGALSAAFDLDQRTREVFLIGAAECTLVLVGLSGLLTGLVVYKERGNSKSPKRRYIGAVESYDIFGRAHIAEHGRSQRVHHQQDDTLLLTDLLCIGEGFLRGETEGGYIVEVCGNRNVHTGGELLDTALLLVGFELEI